MKSDESTSLLYSPFVRNSSSLAAPVVNFRYSRTQGRLANKNEILTLSKGEPAHRGGCDVSGHDRAGGEGVVHRVLVQRAKAERAGLRGGGREYAGRVGDGGVIV